MSVGAVVAVVLGRAHWLLYFVAYVLVCALIQALFDSASSVWLNYGMSGLYVVIYVWYVRHFFKALYWRVKTFWRGHEREQEQIPELPLSRRIFEIEDS